MKTTIHFVLFFLFLILQDLKAQQEQILSIDEIFAQDRIIDNKANQFISFEKNNLNYSQRVNNPILNNSVRINQIGDYHNSQVYLKSSQSNLIVNQLGTGNDLLFSKSAPEINQMIQQTGNSNFISDFSLYSNYKVDMQINQQGNNLTLFSNGTNSISKEMKITQSGNSGTIYIFNR